jgi:hypothetical protein
MLRAAERIEALCRAQPRQRAVLNSIRCRRRALGDSRALGDPVGAVSSGEMGPAPVMRGVEPAREGGAGAG